MRQSPDDSHRGMPYQYSAIRPQTAHSTVVQNNQKFGHGSVPFPVARLHLVCRLSCPDNNVVAYFSEIFTYPCQIWASVSNAAQTSILASLQEPLDGAQGELEDCLRLTGPVSVSCCARDEYFPISLGKHCIIPAGGSCGYGAVTIPVALRI